MARQYTLTIHSYSNPTSWAWFHILLIPKKNLPWYYDWKSCERAPWHCTPTLFFDLLFFLSLKLYDIWIWNFASLWKITTRMWKIIVQNFLCNIFIVIKNPNYFSHLEVVMFQWSAKFEIQRLYWCERYQKNKKKIVW
jgi:hypothetical protein